MGEREEVLHGGSLLWRAAPLGRLFVLGSMLPNLGRLRLVRPRGCDAYPWCVLARGPSRRDGRRGLSGRRGLRREQLAAGAGDGVADVLAPQLAEGVECGAQPPRVLGWRNGEGMSRLGWEVGLEE